MKDLRSQSDLYSQKIRTLLNNFLRDLLAGIILVGFTIFTKFTDNIGLEKHQLLMYVFNGLGIYYFISILMQAATDFTDIAITNKELRYWKNAAKELIPEREFDQYFTQSLRSRRISWRVLYPLLAALYVLIGIACFKYPAFFEKLLTK